MRLIYEPASEPLYISVLDCRKMEFGPEEIERARKREIREKVWLFLT